jgi:hypothetical protein
MAPIKKRRVINIPAKISAEILLNNSRRNYRTKSDQDTNTTVTVQTDIKLKN